MEKIRIGNDIAIKWAIFASEMQEESGSQVPYDLTGRDLSLYVETGVNRLRIREFEVAGNELRFTFYGMYQSSEGIYRLTMVENEGLRGMHTVDEDGAFELELPEEPVNADDCGCEESESLETVFSKEGFELVESTAEEGGEAEDHVEVVHLSFRSTMLLSGFVEVIDSLDSTRKDAALSANQGNVLLTKVMETNHKLTKVEAAVKTLTGDITVVGSIDNKIHSAVKWGSLDD